MSTVYERVLKALNSFHLTTERVFATFKSSIFDFDKFDIDHIESGKKIPQLNLCFSKLIFEGNEMESATIDILLVGKNPKARFIDAESILPKSGKETPELVFNYIKPKIEKYIEECLKRKKKVGKAPAKDARIRQKKRGD